MGFSDPCYRESSADRATAPAPFSDLRRIVGRDAHREVARLRDRLATRAKRVAAATKAVPSITIRVASGSSGWAASLAWKRILAAVPEEPLIRPANGSAAVWRIIRPQGAVGTSLAGPVNPWEADERNIVVGFVAIGRCRGKAYRGEGAWSLAFTDRAVGQIRESRGPGDVTDLLLAAHDTLLQASVALAEPMMSKRFWTLPAGDGAFLIELLPVVINAQRSDTMVLVRAHEWLPTGDLGPDGQSQAAQILAPHTGRTLGDGLLLPSPLRRAAPPFMLPGDVNPACDIPT